jgi:hypothetical protein
MDEFVACWKSKPILQIAMKRYVYCHKRKERETILFSVQGSISTILRGGKSYGR